jgi:hypothetical protein
MCLLTVVWILAACNENNSETPYPSAAGGDAEVMLQWDEVDGAQAYNIYWNATGLDSVADEKQSVDSSPYVISGLRNESTYYFRITVVSSAGESAASQQITARPTAAKLQSIQVTPDSQFMIVGTRGYFTATGVYSDGSKQDVSRLARWSSSDTSIATVRKDGRGAGLVDAMRPGVAYITATYRGVRESVAVLPTYGQLREITLLPHDPQITRNSTLAFKAIGNYGDILQDITASVSWRASNPNVASVGATRGHEGMTRAFNVGDSVISASLDGLVTQSQLLVTNESLQSIILTPENPTIELGSTQAFTATGIYTDGSSKDITQNLLWESSDSSVASVANYSSGVYDPTPAGVAQTALGQDGVTVIAARLQNVSAETTLSVATPQIQALTLSPQDLAIAPGQTIQLSAALDYTNGSSYSNPPGVEFESSDNAVAVVDASGVVTGIAAGVTTIVASYSELPTLFASASVRVIALPADHATTVIACTDCHNGLEATGKPDGHPVTSENCETCHSNNAWLPLILPFGHENTTDLCINCHNGIVSVGKSAIHPVTTELCEACHATNSWLPVISPFDHSQVLTPFCEDCHARFSAPNKPPTHPATSDLCEACHYNNAWLPLIMPFDHSQVTISNCISSGCHSANDQPIVHPNTTDDCALCHRVNSWLPAITLSGYIRFDDPSCGISGCNNGPSVSATDIVYATHHRPSVTDIA